MGKLSLYEAFFYECFYSPALGKTLGKTMASNYN